MCIRDRGEAVRTANADNPTEAEQRQAAGTLASIEGTNLYDAVVENINGGLAKVAELLGRNEAEQMCIRDRNKENREIRKLSKERMKEHHKYLVNKGKNTDASKIPVCAIIGLGYRMKYKEKRFTLFSCIGLFIGIG